MILFFAMALHVLALVIGLDVSLRAIYLCGVLLLIEGWGGQCLI